jgi:hypothetical protein
MSASETTTLLPVKNGAAPSSGASTNGAVGTIFLVLQVLLLVFFTFGTSYSPEEYKVKE